MHYQIQLPHIAPPASGYAVWVYLHGALSTADQGEALFGAAAQAQQVVLLAPQASRPCGDGFCWSFAHDAQAIRHLLALLQTTFPINSNRVSLLGYSMGCTMGLWLLAQQPTSFAAFAALGMGSAFEPWEHDDGGIDRTGLRASAAHTPILLAVDQRDPGGNNTYVEDNLVLLHRLGFQITIVRPNAGTHAISDAMRAAVVTFLPAERNEVPSTD